MTPATIPNGAKHAHAWAPAFIAAEAEIMATEHDRVAEIVERLTRIEERTTQALERLSVMATSAEVADMRRRIDGLESGQTWVTRLIIGAVITALMAALIAARL